MRRETCQRSPWTESDAIASVLFGLFMVAGTLMARLSGSLNEDPQPITIRHLAAMLVPSLFAIGLLARRCVESRCSPWTLLGVRDAPREILHGAFMGILLVPGAIALSWLTGLAILSLTGEPPAPQLLMRSLMMEETATAVAGAAFFNAITLVPIAEEILYRGTLVAVILRGRGTAFTVLITALFFSLLHLSPVHLPALTLAGAGFALVYIASGSLLTSIAMHAAFNAANLLLITWPRLAATLQTA